MTTVPTPFITPAVVKPEWIDANGHMNVIYYMECFYFSSEIFFDYIGVKFGVRDSGNESAPESRSSLMTLASNIDYRGELLLAERLRTTTQLLDRDHNKVHLYFETWNAEKNTLSAVAEILFLYVDLEIRKGSNFQSFTMDRLAEVEHAHRVLGVPVYVGRRIGIRRENDCN